MICLKVLLYTENEKLIGKSGLGKAIKHQMKALEDNNIDDYIKSYVAEMPLLPDQVYAYKKDELA